MHDESTTDVAERRPLSSHPELSCKHRLRGEVSIAIGHLAEATRDLANLVRISPMRDLAPAYNAALDHSLSEVNKARRKLEAARLTVMEVAHAEADAEGSDV